MPRRTDAPSFPAPSYSPQSVVTLSFVRLCAISVQSLGSAQKRFFLPLRPLSAGHFSPSPSPEDGNHDDDEVRSRVMLARRGYSSKTVAFSHGFPFTLSSRINYDNNLLHPATVPAPLISAMLTASRSPPSFGRAREANYVSETFFLLHSAELASFASVSARYTVRILGHSGLPRPTDDLILRFFTSACVCILASVCPCLAFTCAYLPSWHGSPEPIAYLQPQTRGLAQLAWTGLDRSRLGRLRCR
ncbi:unnamed protein product [Protopolystoma xenopodis]|uniref:Uncharacterized protein n=1 Tax=Protopolystoma xenopodis TaxID=117903 RepID=A0A448WIC8_9PLAT|nr:unnamed protein product [Protopolystoma xenopodis]